MVSDSLPMPEPTVPNKPLTSFKTLSFDIYGTLIDWEGGILQQCQSLLDLASEQTTQPLTLSDPSARRTIMSKFNDHEAAIQSSHPAMVYDDLLSETYLSLAADFGLDPSDANLKSQAKTFGQSVGSWPAFPDTIDAMQRLGKYYRLIPLSNVDRASFKQTREGPLAGVNFWRVYVAEDIGSYKPDLRNFEYLLRKIDEDDRAEGGRGVDTLAEDLHVAQSLFHDHVPAKKMGMASVWINRSGTGMGGSAEAIHGRGEVDYGWRFATLGEFADEVERQFRVEEASGR